jgi:anti-sigma B factor antagonist
MSATSNCSATVTAQGALAVISLTGEVDGTAGAVLSAAYDEAVASGRSAVLLDFGAVGYINSTGIALIVSVLARARAEGRRVLASGLSDHYRHIFDITRLSDFIQIFANVESAAKEIPEGATT